jgi:uncharacterized RDD family membrane protein YckC
VKLDTTQSSETPEGLALVLRPAGAAPRLVAYAIDWIARLTAFGAMAAVLGPLGKFGQGIALVLYFGLEWIYPVVFELLPGAATPGKRSMGLQVVMDDGLPVTVAASVVRNLLRTADFLPFAFFAGLLSMMLRADFKRLGDIAGGTLVVHKEHVRRHGALPKAEPRAPRLPLTRAQQMAVIRLAGRSARLTAARVDELAAHAEPVLPRGDKDEPGPRLLSLAQWLAGQR